MVEAAELMMDRHIRRVPLVDGTAILGLVTLDDLILERAVDGATLAAIVRGQLSEPARLKPKGKVHPTAPVHGSSEAVQRSVRRRHEARQRQAYAGLVKNVMAVTELESSDLAESALLIVISSLVRRLTPEEAADFLAQMPKTLHEYAMANVPAGPDVSICRELVEEQVARVLEVTSERAARIVRRVGQVLAASISRGELSDIRSQLPAGMRSILERSDS